MAKDSKDVEEILTALQAGEDVEQNFERLFRIFHPRLVSCFLNWGCDLDRSRELAQDTLLAAFQNLGEFRGDCPFAPWLFKIARHRRLNENRWNAAKKRAGKERSLDQEEENDRNEALQDGQGPEQQYDILRSDERLARLQQEVDNLPPRARECLLLRVLQGMSYKEIAQLQGISIGTVKSHLHEARRLLRERLEGDFDDIDF